MFFFLSSTDMNELFFKKNSLRSTSRVSNNLNSDQDPPSVGPDLGPDYLQRLSADDKNGP